MNINFRGTLSLEDLEATMFTTEIGREKVQVCVTPRTRDVKIDILKSEQWQYALELSLDQTNIYRENNGIKVAKLCYTDNKPDLTFIGYMDSTVTQLPAEFNEIPGVQSEMGFNSIKVIGVYHQLDLNTVGDKLCISLNRKVENGAPKQPRYDIRCGPDGLLFNKYLNGEIQYLQQVTEAERVPGNYQEGELIWGYRFNELGCSNFTL